MNNRTMLRITAQRWKQVVLHWDIWTAGVLAVIIGLVVSPSMDYSRLLWIQIAVAAASLGFVFAGVGLMLNWLKGELFGFLTSVREDGYDQTIWPFWFSAWLVILVIAVGILSVALLESVCEPIRRSLLAIVSFLFLWSIFNISPLVFFLFRFARFRDMYYRKIEGDDSSTDIETHSSESL